MRDEEFYGLAAREVHEREFNEALMAKAYALALGDPERTKALYIGMRADQLIEDAAIAAANFQARERERQASEKAAREEAERQRVEIEKQRKNAETLKPSDPKLPKTTLAAAVAELDRLSEALKKAQNSKSSLF